MKRKKIGLKHGTIKKQNFYEKKFFQLNFDKGAFTVYIDLSVPCFSMLKFYLLISYKNINVYQHLFDCSVPFFSLKNKKGNGTCSVFQSFPCFIRGTE